jgi:hypothetical protein
MLSPRLKLEDIRIASPCPALWSEMNGNDRVRNCNICGKNVFNISKMTRAEAKTLINKEKQFCARIFVRKDGSVMTSDCPVGLRSIHKLVVKRLTAIVALVIGLIGTITVAMDQRLSNAIAEKMIPQSLIDASTEQMVPSEGPPTMGKAVFRSDQEEFELRSTTGVVIANRTD